MAKETLSISVVRGIARGREPPYIWVFATTVPTYSFRIPCTPALRHYNRSRHQSTRSSRKLPFCIQAYDFAEINGIRFSATRIGVSNHEKAL